MELNAWVIFGLGAQLCFFLRFFIQWIASERRRKSVIPVHFWYLSVIGGIGLLAYAIHINDMVFVLGQGCGLLIYLRNIILIHGGKKRKSSSQAG